MTTTLRQPLAFTIALITLLVICSETPVVHAESPEGFTPLFNGRDLAGWKGLVGNPKTRATMSAEDLAKAQAKAETLGDLPEAPPVAPAAAP